MNGCEILGCRRERDLVYLDRGVCSHHWDRFATEDQPADALARALGIPVAEATTTEVDMSETTKSKRTKVVKVPKPKKERAPKDAQPKRVFAIRVTDAELEAIHKAAGPRNATRFIRAVAAAFAAEDETAFKAMLKEARESRV